MVIFVLNRDPLSVAKKEVLVLSDFKHPNIIRLLGYCIYSSDAQATVSPICLVYELAANQDLAVNLRNDGRSSRLTWALRLRIALEVASALSYLHSRWKDRPAFHRDVKSANIALTASLEAKLIDCGLAKYIPKDSVVHSITTPGMTTIRRITAFE